MKSAASSSSARAHAATSAHPSVLLAACQLPAAPAQAEDIKLNVIMRGAALDSADHVEKACGKLRPEAPANDLQAAQRVDSTCAPTRQRPPLGCCASIFADESILSLQSHGPCMQCVLAQHGTKHVRKSAASPGACSAFDVSPEIGGHADRALRTLMAWMVQEAAKRKQAASADSVPSQAVHVFTTTPLHTQLAALRSVCGAAQAANMRLHIVVCERGGAGAEAQQLTPAHLAAAAAAAEAGCEVSRLEAGATLAMAMSRRACCRHLPISALVRSTCTTAQRCVDTDE